MMTELDFTFKPSALIEDEVTSARLNAMLKAIKMAQPGINHPGLNFTQNGNGWTLSNSKNSQTITADFPWRPYVINGLNIKIIPGTVNNILPTNWNDTFTLAASATGNWAWLAVTIDQRGDVVSAAIATGSTVPTPAAPDNDGTIPTTLYAALFAYDSNATGVNRFYTTANQNLAVDVTVTDPDCAQVYRSAKIINA